jgi:hypothetical protein
MTLAASLNRSGEPDAFALHVLNDDFQTLGLGYTLDKAWPILKQAYTSSTRAKLVLGDVETFDWGSQTMTLTLSASNALKAAFNIHNRVELSNAFGRPHRAFVVVVKRVPRYGGIFLEPGSQMALRYPVIYVDEDDDGKVLLTIRPIHTVGDALIKLSESDPLWKTIKQEQIRDILGKAGKLTP